VRQEESKKLLVRNAARKDDDTLKKLRITGMEACVGFNHAGLDPITGNKAIWVSCESAPEFKFTIDYQLETYNGLCLHVVSGGEIEARSCQKNKDEQIFYATIMNGYDESWRFLNKYTGKWFGHYDDHEVSKDADNLIASILRGLSVTVYDFDEKKVEDWFVGLTYEFIYKR